MTKSMRLRSTDSVLWQIKTWLFSTDPEIQLLRENAFERLAVRLILSGGIN